MVERYEDCVPASNPDYYSIKKLLDMLNNKHEYKEVSRYDFLNQVRLTLRESSCMKVWPKISFYSRIWDTLEQD